MNDYKSDSYKESYPRNEEFLELENQEDYSYGTECVGYSFTTSKLYNLGMHRIRFEIPENFRDKIVSYSVFAQNGIPELDVEVETLGVRYDSPHIGVKCKLIDSGPSEASRTKITFSVILCLDHET